MKEQFLTSTLPKLIFAPVPFSYTLQRARLLRWHTLFDTPYLQTITRKAFYYDSSYGYQIQGEILFAPVRSERYIILLHGYYANQQESIALAPLFLKHGYNVITVDSRHHGKSAKTFISFGVFERKDLKLLIDYLMPKLAKDACLGIFGHSLGAAIALQTAAIDSRIDFVIASAPFNRLDETLVAHFLYRKQNWLTTSDWQTFYQGAQKLYKLNFNNLSVAASASQIQCPVLYLHGLDDAQNPAYMSAELHAATQHSVLFTFPHTTHNTIFTRNYLDASMIIYEFLDFADSFQES